MIEMTRRQKFENCKKYKKYYDSIINHYKRDQINDEEIYCEVHHIIPKSLGGENIKENKVVLPYRVHVFVHECLFMYYRFSDDEQSFKKMSAALHAMYSNSELGKRKMTHSKKMAFFKEISRQHLDFNARKFSAFGKTFTIKEWAAYTGIKSDTITSRIRMGWEIEDVLTPDSSNAVKKHIKRRKRKYSKIRYRQLKPMFDEYAKHDNGLGGYIAVVEKFNYALSYSELRRSFFKYVPEYKKFQKSKLRTVAYDGQTMTYTQLAKKFNINKNVLASRLKDGWSVDDAVSIPVGFEMDFAYNREKLKPAFECWKEYGIVETCRRFGFKYKNDNSLRCLFRKYFASEYEEARTDNCVNADIDGIKYRVLEIAKTANVSRCCIYSRIAKGYNGSDLFKKRVVDANDPDYVKSKRNELLPYLTSYNKGGYRAVKKDFPECPYSANALRRQFRAYISDVYIPSENTRRELRIKMGQQIEIDGITKAIGEWSKESGIPVWKISQRLSCGITGKDLLIPGSKNTHYIEFNGKIYNGYVQLAKEFGVSRGMIMARLRKGETLKQALSRPSNRKSRTGKI